TQGCSTIAKNNTRQSASTAQGKGKASLRSGAILFVLLSEGHRKYASCIRWDCRVKANHHRSLVLLDVIAIIVVAKSTLVGFRVFRRPYRQLKRCRRVYV